MVNCNNQQPKNNSTLDARVGRTRKLDVVAHSNSSISSTGSNVDSESSGKPTKKQRTQLNLLEQLPISTISNNEDSSSSNSSSNCNGVLHEAITTLNSQAMSLYKQGDFDTATALFRKALFLRNNLKSASFHDCFLPIIPYGNDDDTIVDGSDDADNIDSDTPRINNVTACITVSAVSVVPSTSSYIYQRMDFDEGLNVYSEPMALNNIENPQAVEATLLFNAGQARKKLNDMEGAAKFYDRAVKVFLPSFSDVFNNNYQENNNIIPSIKTKDTIIIPLLHAVGLMAYRNGKLDEALTIYETALRHCHYIDGERDISAGRTLNCIGVICYHMSTEQSDRAKVCFEQALEIQANCLGEDSLELATTFNNLGRIHVQREEFSAALAHYEKALDIRKALGSDHIDFAAVCFNAGQSCHQLGFFDRALGLYQEFLRVALKKLPRKHRDVAVVLSGIAQIYQEKKEFDRALSLYEESLDVGRAALGNSHSEVAMLLNRLGNYYSDRGMFDKALATYEEGLLIEKKVLEECHPNIIVTMTNLGEIYRQRNDYDNAIRLYLDALRLQKKCYGSSSLEVSGTLNVLGLIYDLQGNSTAALSCLQEALVFRRSVLGDNHLEVSATLNYLGTIFYRRGASCLALELFTESLRIRIDNLGKDHREVSFTLYNVALCLFNIGSYQEAIKCFKETLRIEQSVLGENHKDMECTHFKLGEVYLAKGELDNALTSFEAALKIERESTADADPRTVAQVLNEIGKIHLFGGNTRVMMNAFIDAARTLQHAGLFQNDCLSLPDQLYGFSVAFPSSAAAA